MVMRILRHLTGSSGHRSAQSDASVVASVLAMWTLGSLLAIVIWGSTVGDGSGRSWFWNAVAVYGHASIVSAAAFTVGALLGFLFGIPRTVQEPAAVATPGQPWSLQSTNTNLEQISDWLTKILVGVGLTQVGSLREVLTSMASYFAVANAPSVTLALILNFSIAGFLTGYLLTRLFLTGAFVAVEQSLRDRAHRAEALQEAGEWNAALIEYESALQQITPATPAAERARIYEGLIFNSLYEQPPRGFEKAIAYGERYLKEEPAPSARVLAFLAAAYGQQYAVEAKQGTSSSEKLASIKAKALDAVQKALARDASVIELLRTMWDPNARGKSPGDDDLEVFFGDPDFKARLG